MRSRARVHTVADHFATQELYGVTWCDVIMMQNRTSAQTVASHSVSCQPSECMNNVMWKKLSSSDVMNARTSSVESETSMHTWWCMHCSSHSAVVVVFSHFLMLTKLNSTSTTTVTCCANKSGDRKNIDAVFLVYGHFWFLMQSSQLPYRSYFSKCVLFCPIFRHQVLKILYFQQCVARKELWGCRFA